MSEDPLDTKVMLSTRELAKYWGIKIQTIQKWRTTGDGPIYIKIGNRCMYPRKAILAYQQRRTFQGTSERITDGGDNDK